MNADRQPTWKDAFQAAIAEAWDSLGGDRPPLGADGRPILESAGDAGELPIWQARCDWLDFPDPFQFAGRASVRSLANRTRPEGQDGLLTFEAAWFQRPSDSGGPPPMPHAGGPCVVRVGDIEWPMGGSHTAAFGVVNSLVDMHPPGLLVPVAFVCSYGPGPE